MDPATVWIPRPVVFWPLLLIHASGQKCLCSLPVPSLPISLRCASVTAARFTSLPLHSPGTRVYTRALLLSAQYYKAGSVVLRFLLKILTPKIKVSEVELWGGDRHGGGALTNEISALRTEATERPLSSSAL